MNRFAQSCSCWRMHNDDYKLIQASLTLEKGKGGGLYMGFN